MEKIWLVEEFIRNDDERRTKCTAKGFYSSKIKALAAIHHDIADIVEDNAHLNPDIIYDGDHDGITATVYIICGETYGMYDWYYVITAQDVDLPFDQYR